ncbi:hypothetical protein GQ457_09G015770 [Hibiscus cannabinus]
MTSQINVSLIFSKYERFQNFLLPHHFPSPSRSPSPHDRASHRHHHSTRSHPVSSTLPPTRSSGPPSVMEIPLKVQRKPYNPPLFSSSISVILTVRSPYFDRHRVPHAELRKTHLISHRSDVGKPIIGASCFPVTFAFHVIFRLNLSLFWLIFKFVKLGI